MKNIIILTFASLLISCSGEKSMPENTNKNNTNSKVEETTTPTQEESNNIPIKKIVETILKPEEDKFYNDALNLQILTNEFVKEITKDNLEQLKKQWFEVAKDWGRCHAFNIGKIKRIYRINNFARFPIDTTALENKITKLTSEGLNPEKANFGSETKGIYGIEYLIFKSNTENNLKTFKSNEIRKKTLQHLVNKLIKSLESRQKKWKNIIPSIIENNRPQDSKDNSINLMFGGIDNIIHFIWETKIGKAIRKKDIEARFSKKSLDIVKENIAITKKVYFEGGFAKNIEEKGLGYINEDIKKRYKNIESIINSIEHPLVDAVNNPTDVAKLKKLITELEKLEKTEFNKVETIFSLIDGTKEGDGD